MRGDNGGLPPFELIRPVQHWLMGRLGNCWGGPALLQSRATDEKGNTQPARKAFISEYAPDNRFHNNSVVTWQVNADGSVKNVYV